MSKALSHVLMTWAIVAGALLALLLISQAVTTMSVAYQKGRTERASVCAQVGGTFIDATDDCIAPRSAG